ncbi:MAG: class I SAM-dependent methyltransferase, partial [Shimia sp.]
RMTVSKLFWSRFARPYAKQAVADGAAYERKLSETRDRLRPTDRVLELGCGTGSTALRHAPHVAFVEATDFAPGMIAVAEEKRVAAGIDNVRFSVAPAEAPPFDDGSFDAVLALNLLHLVADVPMVLAQCARVLRPGGLLVMSTMPVEDRAWWMGVATRVVPLRTNRFSEASHLADIAAAGFEIEHSWTPAPNAALFLIARKRA